MIFSYLNCKTNNNFYENKIKQLFNNNTIQESVYFSLVNQNQYKNFNKQFNTNIVVFVILILLKIVFTIYMFYYISVNKNEYFKHILFILGNCILHFISFSFISIRLKKLLRITTLDCNYIKIPNQGLFEFVQNLSLEYNMSIYSVCELPFVNDLYTLFLTENNKTLNLYNSFYKYQSHMINHCYNNEYNPLKIITVFIIVLIILYTIYTIKISSYAEAKEETFPVSILIRFSIAYVAILGLVSTYLFFRLFISVLKKIYNILNYSFIII